MSPEFIDALKQYGLVGGGLLVILMLLMRRQWSPKWYTDELKETIAELKGEILQLRAKLEARDIELAELTRLALDATSALESTAEKAKHVMRKVTGKPS